MEKKNIELTCQVAELKEGKLKMEKKIEELETKLSKTDNIVALVQVRDLFSRFKLAAREAIGPYLTEDPELFSGEPEEALKNHFMHHKFGVFFKKLEDHVNYSRNQLLLLSIDSKFSSFLKDKTIDMDAVYEACKCINEGKVMKNANALAHPFGTSSGNKAYDRQHFQTFDPEPIKRAILHLVSNEDQVHCYAMLSSIPMLYLLSPV